MTTLFEQSEYDRRHAAIRDRMREEGLDAMLAYSNAKVRGCVRYLSGYYTRWAGAQSQPDGSYQWFGSCVVLFPADGEPVLITDQPWDVERAREVSVFPDTRYASNFGTELGPQIAAAGYRRVGID